MSDHEFEKQVHQKLQELKLRPSDTVWMEVEKNIRQDQHRRPFLWWWMAALFICVTAGGYILYRYTAQTPITTNTQTTVASLSNIKSAETSSNSTNQSSQSSTLQPVTDKTAAASQNNNQHSIAPNGEQKQPTVEGPDATAETTNPHTVAENKQPAVASADNSALTKTTIKRNKKPVQQPLANNIGGHTNPHEPVIVSKLPYEKQRSNKKKRMVEAMAITTPVYQEKVPVIEVAQPNENAWNSTMPIRVNMLDSAIATNKAVIMPFKTMAPEMMPSGPVVALSGSSIIRKKASLWHWGVVADAGYSRITESKLFQLKGLLGNEKFIAEDLSARSSASPSTSPSNGTNSFSGTNNQLVSWQAYAAPPKKASPIQADVAFSVGLFVQRTLSPRLKLSLGLEYSSISVHTQVGQKVNSPNNPIVVNMGTSQAALVSEYYKYPGTDTAQTISSAAYYQGMTTSSQKYTYRFHYLEIPLMASWQINKGRGLPPFQLEAGVSMARLLSVDALHYEGLKGVYYKDNDLFNKTQFNFVTGLSVGLLQQSKHPLWVGPNLRYALNGLVDKEVSTGQYIWSAGVSVKMLLGKL
ncbi:MULTISPECIES: outer membrane beta-barrel protein [Niastella]|uniref:Outer membrane beta-barrel protein n=1 Tax=Niastella soli TaxID=2821487 RepID=A0ABS3Z0B1_9BACT|nr:outer membrane beta-barrel protein [Niastella soli]MBO9203603.1 outer membrane beta-barrel protein [Niastella soli]